MIRQLLFFSVLLLVSCAQDQTANVNFTTTETFVGVDSVSFDVSISVDEGETPTQAGIAYSLSPEVEIPHGYYYYGGSPDYHQEGEVYAQISNEPSGSMTFKIGGLNENAVYYYRPFCVVKGAIQYGEEDTVKTLVPQGLTVGPAGGYVIYDDGNGGGIEIALVDISTTDQYDNLDFTHEWGCSGNSGYWGALSPNVGQGQSNTNTILGACPGSSVAAKLCDDWVYNGFDDWYLPTREELFLAYTQIASNGYGNFSNSRYWTSYSDDYSTAGFCNMDDGTYLYHTYRTNQYRVRAVRTF